MTRAPNSTLRKPGLLFAALLCWGNLSHAQDSAGAATPDSERLRRLEEAVLELRSENRELREQVRELRSSRTNVTPAVEAAGPIGANALVAPATTRSSFVAPGGKEANLKLGGFIQVNAETGDVSSFEGRLAGGPNEVSNRLRLRRARLNVSGDFQEEFDFKLEGDFEQGDGLSGGRTGFSGTDLFLNWNRHPEVNIKIGQFKAPFGLEQTTSDTTLFTVERTLATGAFTPERQIGVQLWGWPLANSSPDRKEWLGYALGVFNGNGRNTTTNDNNQFMFAGRIEALAFAGKLFAQPSKIKLGVNGYRSRDGANVPLSPVGNLRLQTDGSLAAFATHTPDERRAWGADASLTVGPFDLIAEYLEERIRPNSSSPNFTEFTANGYYVQGSCFLSDNQLQLVGRWDGFNPGQAASDNLNSLTAGLNYYIRGNELKLMLDYIHTRSDYRRNHPSTGKSDFDQMLARLQLMF